MLYHFHPSTLSKSYILWYKGGPRSLGSDIVGTILHITILSPDVVDLLFRNCVSQSLIEMNNYDLSLMICNMYTVRILQETSSEREH